MQWEALSRGEFSVYVPSYSALLTQVDPELYPASDGFDVEHVGNESEFTRNEAGERVCDDALIAENEKLAMQGTDSKALAYVFMDLNTLAYNHRASPFCRVSRWGLCPSSLQLVGWRHTCQRRGAKA